MQLTHANELIMSERAGKGVAHEMIGAFIGYFVILSNAGIGDKFQRWYMPPQDVSLLPYFASRSRKAEKSCGRLVR